MKAKYSDCNVRSGRNIAHIPALPWPTGMPAPANSNVPGRRILSLGGITHQFIFTQDAGQSSWVDRISGTVATGGDGVKREFVDYSRQNYNIVYAGPNVSTNGGGSWGVTANQYPVIAMSHLNGDIVYTVVKSEDTYTVKKSTNRGASWLATNVYSHTNSTNIADIRNKVWVDPNNDNQVYTCTANGDLILRKWNGSSWSTTNTNLRSRYGTLPPGWEVIKACVDYSDSQLIYALINVAGAPTIFRGTWDAGFTTCSWEDITYNAPRISWSTNLFVSPVTGDVILGSGNGNFVFPAPASWKHSDINKRQYKSALWNNQPKPIPGDLVNENFNKLSTGSTPAGWTLSGTGTVTVQNMPSVSDKSMRLHDTGSGTSITAYKNFAPQTDTITTEFKLRFSAVGNAAGLELRDSAGNTAVNIKTMNNGSLTYRNSAGNWVYIQTYSANTWYTIRVIASPATDTCSIYIDDVLVKKDVDFNTAVSSISDVRFVSGANFVGDMYIDDPRVITGGYIMDKDFNAETSGSAPAGWTVDGDVKINNTPSSTNKSIKLNDTVATAVTASRAIGTQTGIVTAEYAFMVPTAVDWAGIHLEDSAAVGGVILKTKGGQITYKNSSGTWINLKPYTANTWYSIKVVADVATNTFDVYIDGEKLAADVQFTAAVDHISAVKFTTGTSQTTPLFIDNVMISVPQ